MPKKFSMDTTTFYYGRKLKIAEGYKYRNLLEIFFDFDFGEKQWSVKCALILHPQAHLQWQKNQQKGS